MKKNILKAVFVAAFAMMAGYGVYTTQIQTSLSDLALDNVEALASGESGKVNCCPDPGDSCTLSSGDVIKDSDEC